MRWWIRRLAVLFVCALTLTGGADAVSARSAVVIDGTTGQTLFEQNADERLPMASTTKIMTAITAIENFDLDRTYTVKPEYTRVEGSSMYLKPGERVTLRETLYGLLLMSGNDAALAIAGECGGLESFVGLMNDTAGRLKLQDTHFDNPNGLDGETHYTTARELARLAAYAMENEEFRAIASSKTYSENGRHMTNHNRMLRLYEGAVGVKTGFTKRSGRCLVSAAERNGRQLIAVTLNAPDDWNDHIAMLDAGFAQYEECKLCEAGDVLRVQPVAGGGGGALPVVATEPVSAYLTQAERQAVTPVFLGPRFTYAPVRAGERYGSVCFQVEGATLAQCELHFAGSAVLLPEEKSAPARIIERIQGLLP